MWPQRSQWLRSILSGLMALAVIGLLVADRLGSTPTECEANPPSFLQGTVDDCEAGNPQPAPADTELKSHLASR